MVSTGLLANIFNVNKLMGFVRFSIIFVAKLRSVLFYQFLSVEMKRLLFKNA